jgi:hypothetical protein
VRSASKRVSPEAFTPSEAVSEGADQ